MKITLIELKKIIRKNITQEIKNFILFESKLKHSENLYRKIMELKNEFDESRYSIRDSEQTENLVMPKVQKNIEIELGDFIYDRSISLRMKYGLGLIWHLKNRKDLIQENFINWINNNFQSKLSNIKNEILYINVELSYGPFDESNPNGYALTEFNPNLNNIKFLFHPHRTFLNIKFNTKETDYITYIHELQHLTQMVNQIILFIGKRVERLISKNKLNVSNSKIADEFGNINLFLLQNISFGQPSYKKSDPDIQDNDNLDDYQKYQMSNYEYNTMLSELINALFMDTTWREKNYEDTLITQDNYNDIANKIVKNLYGNDIKYEYIKQYSIRKFNLSAEEVNEIFKNQDPLKNIFHDKRKFFSILTDTDLDFYKAYEYFEFLNLNNHFRKSILLKDLVKFIADELQKII